LRPAWIVELAPTKLGDDEVEQIYSDVQARTSQRQYVVGEPGGERPDVAGQSMRSTFDLQSERDSVGKVRIVACFSGIRLQLLAPRLCTSGDAGCGRRRRDRNGFMGDHGSWERGNSIAQPQQFIRRVLAEFEPRLSSTFPHARLLFF
jgi:hypothetical protein